MGFGPDLIRAVERDEDRLDALDRAVEKLELNTTTIPADELEDFGLEIEPAGGKAWIIWSRPTGLPVLVVYSEIFARAIHRILPSATLNWMKTADLDRCFWPEHGPAWGVVGLTPGMDDKLVAYSTALNAGLAALAVKKGLYPSMIWDEDDLRGMVEKSDNY